MTAETKTHVLRDQRYFEKGPPNAEIAVKISKVTKVCVDWITGEGIADYAATFLYPLFLFILDMKCVVFLWDSVV